MTRDDIIKLAREAGAYPAANTDGALLFWSESQVERFAALVAAAEREACARIVEEYDAYSPRYGNHLTNCAAAIRAKGETK